MSQVSSTIMDGFDGNGSYLFGNDQLFGWGPRYFFTFYTELGDDRKLAAGLECFAFSAIFVLSVLCNAAIAAAVLRYVEMRTVTNCFLLNLTVADLLFVSGVPALLYSRLTTEWRLGQNLCKLLPYSQFVCGFVILWTLTWISMDRYRCIVVPPFRSRLTPQRAALLTCITWLVGMVIFLPVALWFHVQKVQNSSSTTMDILEICTLVFPRNDVVSLSLIFTLVTVLFSCLLPLSLVVYHYQQIFRKIKMLRQRWKSSRSIPRPSIRQHQSPPCHAQPQSEHRQSFPNNNNSNNNNHHHHHHNNSDPSVVVSQQERNRFNRHLKVVHIFLANVSAVLIMWLPITALMLLIYLDGRRPNGNTDFFLRSHHFVWALQIALLNTIVNPLLYGLLSENFRNCFTRMWFLSQKRKALNKFVYNEATDGGARNASVKSCTTTMKIAVPVVVINNGIASATATVAEC